MLTYIRQTVIALLLVLVTSSVAGAAAVTQGFKAKTALPTGAVVSLTKGSSDTVEKSTLENESSLIGVVAAAKDALIDLQPAGSDIRVAVSGDTSLLVTNLNGDIKSGEQLVVSPLSGIAMRYSSNVTNNKIVGTAGGDFNTGSAQTTEVEVLQADGQKKKVLIGRISAKLLLNERSAASIPSKNLLSTIGEKLTGRQVSPVKLLASTMVAVSTFTLSGLILNGSIKGSFISLGRNPLSKDSIVSGMLRSSLLAIVIIAMGLSLAYVILLV